MNDINAQEKLQKSRALLENGNEDAAVAALCSCFEELIRRDDEDIRIKSLCDVMVVAAYSTVRAEQLIGCIEYEKKFLNEAERKEADDTFNWLHACAMCFLNIGFKKEGENNAPGKETDVEAKEAAE